MTFPRAALRSAIGGRTAKWVAACIAIDLVTKTTAVLLGSGAPAIDVSKHSALKVDNWFADPTDPRSLLLLVLGAIVCRHAFALTRHDRRRPLVLAPIIGGAVANTLDRWFTGGVHDWFDLGFTATNLADLMLVGGIAIYVWMAWSNAPVPDDQPDATASRYEHGPVPGVEPA